MCVRALNHWLDPQPSQVAKIIEVSLATQCVACAAHIHILDPSAAAIVKQFMSTLCYTSPSQCPMLARGSESNGTARQLMGALGARGKSADDLYLRARAHNQPEAANRESKRLITAC